MEIHLGTGDDTFVMQGGLLLGAAAQVNFTGEGILDAGEGFDSLVLMTERPSNGGERAKIGNWNGISGFELIDMRGAFFVNDISTEVVRNNHSEQLIDDQGVAHQGVLMINGDADDRVSFVRETTGAVKGEQVNFEGKTYDTYLYDLQTEQYEVWIQQGIVVQ